MTQKYWLSAFVGLFAVSACGDDTTDADTDNDTDTDSTGSMDDAGDDLVTTGDAESTSTTTTAAESTDEGTEESTEGAEDSSEGGGPPPGEPTEFTVTITNISQGAVLPTVMSPGVWVEMVAGAEPDVLFELNGTAGAGLEALAEDGVPTQLADEIAANIGAETSGVFSTPVGGKKAGPLLPGSSYEFSFVAQPGNRLAFASMLVDTNDHFLATGPNGISLFTAQNQPRDARDVTDLLRFWDAGTEYNQPPKGGGDQAGSNAEFNAGMPESGAVRIFNTSTRAIPQAGGIVDVDVEFDGDTGAFTINIANISEDFGTLVTNVSGAAYATHADTVRLFTVGEAASPGLELLAEVGDPATLETEIQGLKSGIGESGTVAGAAPGGDPISIVVTPTPDAPLFSFATMVVASNDAFIAPLRPIALLEEDGAPRSTSNIEEDFELLLGVFDAGTEGNEAPGVGTHQPGGLGVTPPKGEGSIEPYFEAANDFGGAALGGLLGVTVTFDDPEYTITISNESADSAFPVTISGGLSAVGENAEAVTMFADGTPSTPGLEALAEDGDATTLLKDVAGSQATAAITTGGDPLVLVLDPADGAFFNFAAMVVPTNDTFVSMAAGLELTGTAEELEAAIEAALVAWDAGTEANQSGGGGRDMAGAQEAPNTGAPEGDGIISDADDDPIWVYPNPTQIVQVTVAPTKK